MAKRMMYVYDGYPSRSGSFDRIYWVRWPVFIRRGIRFPWNFLSTSDNYDSFRRAWTECCFRSSNFSYDLLSAMFKNHRIIFAKVSSAFRVIFVGYTRNYATAKANFIFHEKIFTLTAYPINK